jgi:hypothetical protein
MRNPPPLSRRAAARWIVEILIDVPNSTLLVALKARAIA